MLRRFLTALFPLGLASTCSHGHPTGHHGTGMHHRFENAAQWAVRFDDPARDDWQKPNEVLAALALLPDSKVADLGAGTGYFAVRAAKLVPKGTVYAVDLEPDMVAHINERARTSGISNVKGVLASAASANLPEAVDVVLVVDTYHHIHDRTAYFKALSERLLPGGTVAIVDYRLGQPMGPPEAHRLSDAQVKSEMLAAGYTLRAEHTFLPNQYFLEFTR